MKCQISDCVNKSYCRNYCSSHYLKFNRYGNPLFCKPRAKKTIPNKCKYCNFNIWKAKVCGKCRRRLKLYGRYDFCKPYYRKHFYNENLFDSFSKESVWVLGWLATDGYVSEKKNAITWSLTDKEAVKKIADVFKYTGEIKVSYTKDSYNRKGSKPLYRLSLNSKKLVNRCIELNIRQNKSLTLRMPNIPDVYFYDFLRGVIEGDGSIVTTRGKDGYWRLSIHMCSGSKEFLQNLSEKMFCNPIIYKGKTTYRFSVTGKKAVKICELMYQDCDKNFLSRKKEKYEYYIKMKNLHK